MSYAVNGGGGGFDIGVQTSDPRGMAYDPINAKLYWGDRTANTIIRSNLDGSAQQTVLSITNPYWLALDATMGTLYITSCPSSCDILPYDLQSDTLGSALVTSRAYTNVTVTSRH
ncbi:hypothetical protein EKD04_021030, partial [Chloroflexales bacterium ZM16-3]|nr:hypothetical protein [Chloroflexales bacterium ZM16-3]